MTIGNLILILWAFWLFVSLFKSFTSCFNKADKKLVEENSQLKIRLVTIEVRNKQLDIELSDIVGKYNGLVETINRKGGMAFLKGIPQQQFSNDEVRQLIKLCHPDKHGNSPTATAITAKLLGMRK